MEQENTGSVFGCILIIIGVLLAALLVYWSYEFVFHFADTTLYNFLEHISKSSASANSDYQKFDLSLGALVGVCMFSLSILAICISIIVKAFLYSGALIVSKDPSIMRLTSEVSKINRYWSKKLE